jgi:hypothetical protein
MQADLNAEDAPEVDLGTHVQHLPDELPAGSYSHISQIFPFSSI